MSPTAEGSDFHPRTVHRNQAGAKSLLESLGGAVGDPALSADKTQRLLELLAILVRQGHVRVEEVSQALGQPSALELPEEIQGLQQRVADLEAELHLANLSRVFLEDEVGVLERALGKERELVKENLASVAHLEQQLQNARRTTVKLISASRTSLTTLKKVRSEYVAETFAQNALNPLSRDLQEMASTVQELHTLALVKNAAASGSHPTRSADPARR